MYSEQIESNYFYAGRVPENLQPEALIVIYVNSNGTESKLWQS